MTLRVTLEIVPFGEEDQKYEIGRLNISNMGPSNISGFHVYEVAEYPLEDELLHARSDGAWALVRQALTVHARKLYEDTYPNYSRVRKLLEKRLRPDEKTIG